MLLKRKLKIISIVVMAFILSISFNYVKNTYQVQNVISRFTTDEGYTHYRIEIIFKDEQKEIQAKQRVIYTNRHAQTLNNIYFHLYPNAFKEKKTAPFEKKEMDRAYPNNFDPGYIEIITLEEKNKPVDYKIMGDGNTILRITPNQPLNRGESIILDIQFNVKIPNSIGRMGYGENTINITNWYPILAVYDHNGWNLDPYFAIGDPFYSEVGNYDIIANIPSKYKIASTGNIKSYNERRGYRKYTIEAKLVRDFAMVLSDKFEIKEGLADGVRVISYGLGSKTQEALEYGIDAMKIFNNIFGKYPYEQVSIVASDFFIGGMEYPNLVMIGQQLYEMEENFPLEYVIAHEIAHQWWYGIVGNNQIEEPWLDEALTEYSTLMYFEKKYGAHIKEQIFEKMTKTQYQNYIDIYKDRGEEILRSLRSFDSNWEYSSIVYSKGAMFIEELRNIVGDDIFLLIMQNYFDEYKFRNATTKDFFEICQKHTEKDLSEVFEKWLKAFERK